MKKKKALVMIIVLVQCFIVLSSCESVNDKSGLDSDDIDSGSSDASNYTSIDSEDISDDSGSFNDYSNISNEELSDEKSSEGDTSEGDSNGSSIDAPSNENVEYLSVIDCAFVDKNHFVIVGKCQEGASVTAKTTTQTVTSTSDNGFFSIRLKEEGKTTKVGFRAVGEKTEELSYNAVPKTIPYNSGSNIVAANNYVFFYEKAMPFFEHTDTFSEYQLSTMSKNLKNRVNELKSVSPNTELIYVLVPSKASIYPERVPADYQKGTGRSRLEQLNDVFNNCDVTYIDLIDIFGRHKNDPLKLYWNTDSHWGDYGAFIAYTELFNHISERFPAAAPRKQTDFDFVGDLYQGGDMILFLNMDQQRAREYNYLRVPKFDMNSSITDIPRFRSSKYLMYSDDITPEIYIQNNKNNLPDLYVFRDSFGAQIYDILPERSNNTLYKPMWRFVYDINNIKNNSPDYIIYFVAEWNIDWIANDLM